MFLVSEILGRLEGETDEFVMEDFRDGLMKYFGVEARTFLLYEGRPNISFWTA